MSHKTYPAYKPCGVEWLGEIPEHWDVKRLKYIVSEPLQYGANEAAELDDQSLPRYIRITDIDESGRLRDDTFKSLPEDIAQPYLLKHGDLLLARSGATVGKSFYYDPSWGKAAYAGYLIRARFNPSSVNTRFIHYYTNSHTYWEWLNSTLIQATIQNVSAEKYANFFIGMPNSQDQAIIVQFLDRETGRIDGLIERKRRQIELLKEKRAALISACVTGKLEVTMTKDKDGNPSFRASPSSRPMKPSGVEWLGEIPEHWSIFPLFTLLPERAERNAEGQEENVLSLSYGKIIRRNVDNNYGLLPESFDTYQIVSKGHIILRLTDLQNDKRSLRVGLVKETGIITSAYICLNPKDILHPEYAGYLLHSYDVSKVFYSYGGGVRQSMKYDDLKWMPILTPNYQEQHAIASFLDRETGRIDGLIEKINLSIEKLQEYRSALISAAVTGKIDVRESAE